MALAMATVRARNEKLAKTAFFPSTFKMAFLRLSKNNQAPITSRVVMKTTMISAVALSVTLGTGLAVAQSGSTRVLATDGKTYLATPPAIDGCAAGLRFDGIGGVIYCAGFGYIPPPAPGPTVVASNSGGGSDGGNGSNGSTSDTSFADGTTGDSYGDSSNGGSGGAISSPGGSFADGTTGDSFGSPSPSTD